jgi:Holliday junction DNA helicase RuvA
LDFAEESERQLFTLLLSVSGVGPSTAQTMLSTLSPEEVQAAIVGEQVEVIRKVKGIGAKTAQRIIIDLKDKILKGSDELPELSASWEQYDSTRGVICFVSFRFFQGSCTSCVEQSVERGPRDQYCRRVDKT